MKKYLLLLSVVFLVSCGARKTQKSEITRNEKEQTEFSATDSSKVETNKEANTKTTTTTEKEAGSDAVIETTTVEPIDPTKPASVIDEHGKKTELNNAKQTKQKKAVQRDEKSKTVSNIDKKELSWEIEQNHSEIGGKKYIESNSVEKNKETERKEPFNWLWLLAVFVVVLIGRMIYCYKKKIPLL